MRIGRMRRKNWSAIGILGVALLAGFAAARGQDAPAGRRELEFLQRLRDADLGDLAVAQLRALEQAGAPPAELTEVFDLEMARSLMAEAEVTSNVDLAEQNLLAARDRLAKFLGAHPDHPEAATAHRSAGDLSMARGERLLRKALSRRDVARQNAERLQARTEFELARPSYDQATALLRDRVQAAAAQSAAAARPARGARGSRRRLPRGQGDEELTELQLAEEDWLDARFRLASVDYQLATTYPDSADPARQTALQRAAAAFDAIFQGYRGSPLGKHAHFWHGKTLELQGDLRTALDVYQEVLGNAPEPGERGAEDRLSYFADVKLLEIQMLRALSRPDEALAEQRAWLDAWKSQQRQPAYQVLLLDYARTLAAGADALEGRQAEEAILDALSVLNEVARSPGPRQTEAIRLRRELSTRIGRTLEVTSFIDAVAEAEAAVDARDWPGAIGLYERALALSNDVRPVDRIDEVQYRLAYARLLSGDAPAAFLAANELARLSPPREVSPEAAGLAINAALQMAAAAEDPATGRQNLLEIAEYTRTTWPKRAEADDASLALARLRLVERDPDGALEIFSGIPQTSERYPQAQYYAAETLWRRLLEGRRTQAVDEAAAAMQRDEILQQLERCLEQFRAKLLPGVSPPAGFSEAQLLRAEILLDAGRSEDALSAFEPLLQEVMADPAAGLSPFRLRVAAGSVRAALAGKRMDRAGEIAAFLASSGGDERPVNSVLVQFARMLHEQWKQSSADVLTAMMDGDAGRRAEADARLAADQQAVLTYIDQLCPREQLSMGDRIFLGEVAAALGQPELARSQYQKVLDAAEADPAVKSQSRAAVTRVRSLLVGLLRKEQRFAEALEQVDKLVADAPNSMEPLLERARILQSLSEQDAQRYPEAVAAWTKLRNAMTRLPRKPPEYYEVVLGAAQSLFGQAKSATTPPAEAAELKKQAKALLKSTSALAPNLSGPDMVERYRLLLQEIDGDAAP